MANQDTRNFYSLKGDKSLTEGHGRRTAENSCQYMLPALLEKARENPKLKLLDVGCGPGSISIGLAKRMPEGHLTGIDLSPTTLNKAKELAKDQGLTNVSFQQANVYELPFEDGTFDVVHTHQTLIHCEHALRAIKEMVRVTKKGGIVCMRESDVHTTRFWPPSPVLEEAFVTIGKMMRQTEGSCSDAGRRLKAWTVEAGVPRENITFTAGSWCYNTLEERRGFDGGRMLRGGPADEVIKLGLVTRQRVEEYEKAWKEWEEDEDGVLMMLHGEVVATI